MSLDASTAQSSQGRDIVSGLKHATNESIVAGIRSRSVVIRALREYLG